MSIFAQSYYKRYADDLQEKSLLYKDNVLNCCRENLRDAELVSCGYGVLFFCGNLVQ